LSPSSSAASALSFLTAIPEPQCTGRPATAESTMVACLHPTLQPPRPRRVPPSVVVTASTARQFATAPAPCYAEKARVANIPNVSSVFQMYVASVLSECCICFTRMLHVFYLDIEYVCNGFQVFFTCFCSDTCFKCFICLLMLQVFAYRYFKSRSDVTYGIRVESKRGREQSPHGSMAPAMSGQHGPRVGARNTSACGRHPIGASPRVDARNEAWKQTVATGIRPEQFHFYIKVIAHNEIYNFHLINIFILHQIRNI
jgi:hypothetical protein